LSPTCRFSKHGRKAGFRVRQKVRNNGIWTLPATASSSLSTLLNWRAACCVGHRGGIYCCKHCFLDQEPIPYHYTYLVVLLLVGATLFKKAQGFIVSNWIGMTFGWIVFLLSTHQFTESVFDMTSNFQDGGNDVRSPLATAYAAASASCLLAHRARVTSLARCIPYSSCSIHSYLL